MAAMSDAKDCIERDVPGIVANLRARHPELVGGLDDATIGRRFLCFHDEHEMTAEALRAHLRGERARAQTR